MAPSTSALERAAEEFTKYADEVSLADLAQLVQTEDEVDATWYGAPAMGLSFAG